MVYNKMSVALSGKMNAVKRRRCRVGLEGPITIVWKNCRFTCMVKPFRITPITAGVVNCRFSGGSVSGEMVSRKCKFENLR